MTRGRTSSLHPDPDAERPVGRDAEIERVRAVVESGGVLMVTGEAGAGKTTLLDQAVRHAEHQGRRVLAVAGSESETNLAFAGLHQLLAPVVAEVSTLPERQRTALLAALGLGAEAPAPDSTLVSLAVLTALAELAAARPTLVVVDDAQWIDHGSREALAFAARRLAGTGLALLVGVRADAPLPGFDHQHPTLSLGPLDAWAANQLLDRQPHPPTGRQRLHVLNQAGGNPLALTELARAAGDDQHLLPLSDRLERIFAARLPELPARTRRLLLLAAAEPASCLHDVDPEAWCPAEDAGLVRFSNGRVRFRHPLIRSAVYHAASFDQRREAHLRLANALAEPDRRAWHLAAATAHQDESVAAALEATADRARRRAGYCAAATALERAAELSPSPEDRARRLVLAAHNTILFGQSQWTHELVARATALTEDPAVRTAAALRAGQAYTVDHHYAAAFSVLFQEVERVAGSDPAAALTMLATAAVAAYYSGDRAGRDEIRRLLAVVDPEGRPGVERAWSLAVTDPFGYRAGLLRELPRLAEAAGGRPGALISVATVAWLLDEAGLALRLFDDGLSRWRLRGAAPEGLACAAWTAYFEQGRWELAGDMAVQSLARASTANLTAVAAGALGMHASVLAVRGDTATARDLATQALTAIDPLETTSVGVRARWALGMAATADGDHDTAFEQFRMLFTAQGEPLHYHACYPALADLASAAARTGRQREAAAVLTAAERTLAGARSDRLTALLHRARALLATDHDDAEHHYRAALAVPLGEHWPFERAQLLLDHAEWLRRRRRIAEARPRLTAALEIFRRLGARPWADRAQRELRAAGVEILRPVRDPLTELTAQQQQIIRLAARGLTNREIGERMFLSPRTVSSHLYRSFPKLGVTSRAQLRDLLDTVHSG